MERDATQRKRWRALARQARDRLAQAERKLAAAEQKYATSRRRWIETRVIARRQEAERLEAQITELKKAVAEARTALEVTLPDSARREGVPPGWLRE